MTILPDEVWIKIGSLLPLACVSQLALINKRLYSLCTSEYFWKLKVHQEEVMAPMKDDNISWKEFYFSLLNSKMFIIKKESVLRHPGNYFSGKLESDVSLKAKSVAIEYQHAMIVDVNNNVWGLGKVNNTLGLPTSLTPLLDDGMALKAKQVTAGWESSSLIDMSDNILQIFKLEEACLHKKRHIQMKVREIASGNFFTLAIDMDNCVWGWGHNSAGQLGLGHRSEVEDPTQVFIGKKPLKAKHVIANDNRSFVIDMEDNVWSFGARHLSLGDGIPTQIFIDKATPLKAKSIWPGNIWSFIIDLNNDVWHIREAQGEGLEQIYIEDQPLKAKRINGGFMIDMNDNVWVIRPSSRLPTIDWGDGSLDYSIEPFFINGKSVKAKDIITGVHCTPFIILLGNAI